MIFCPAAVCVGVEFPTNAPTFREVRALLSDAIKSPTNADISIGKSAVVGPKAGIGRKFVMEPHPDFRGLQIEACAEHKRAQPRTLERRGGTMAT